jgi:hypothetical protein
MQQVGGAKLTNCAFTLAMSFTLATRLCMSHCTFFSVGDICLTWLTSAAHILSSLKAPVSPAELAC